MNASLTLDSAQQIVARAIEKAQGEFKRRIDMTPLPGGNVLKDASGKQVGAVGISGLALQEDQAIAEAIAASVLLNS